MRIGKIIARPFFGSAHLLDFLPNLGGIMHTKKLCHFRYATQLDMWFFTAIGYTFGLGPYSLVPGAESWTVQMSNKIAPTNGTKQISCHQPLRPMSCRRRAVTAIMGTRNTMLEIPQVTIPTRFTNSMNHQYSERRARPSKLANLLKHTLIASPKSIDFGWGW